VKSGDIRRQRSGSSIHRQRSGSRNAAQATLKSNHTQPQLQQRSSKHTSKVKHQDDVTASIREKRTGGSVVRTNQDTAREGDDENRDPSQPIAITARQSTLVDKIGDAVLGANDAIVKSIFDNEAVINALFPHNDETPFAEVEEVLPPESNHIIENPSTEKSKKKSGKLMRMKLPRLLQGAINIMRVPPIHEKFGCGTCCKSDDTEFLSEEGASAGILEEDNVGKEEDAVEKDRDREEEGVKVDIISSEVGEKAAFEEGASAGISEEETISKEDAAAEKGSAVEEEGVEVDLSSIDFGEKATAKANKKSEWRRLKLERNKTKAERLQKEMNQIAEISKNNKVNSVAFDKLQEELQKLRLEHAELQRDLEAERIEKKDLKAELNASRLAHQNPIINHQPTAGNSNIGRSRSLRRVLSIRKKKLPESDACKDKKLS
jgi:hypothetical protein